MSDTVLVYRGEEIAAYGFGDTHPFGIDRHDVFHSELDKAGLADSIDYGHPRPALVDELALFHTADYIDKVSRLSALGKNLKGTSYLSGVRKVTGTFWSFAVPSDRNSR